MNFARSIGRPPLLAAVAVRCQARQATAAPPQMTARLTMVINVRTVV